MHTPLSKHQNLAKTLGLSVPLYFKREDLHPLLSHKGRSIPIMIDHYLKAGWTDFVISSSGNAALAAGLYIKKINLKRKNKITLRIFVGENIDKEKLKILKNLSKKINRGIPPLTSFGRNDIEISQTKNPKQQAFQIDKKGEAKILRQSTDESALIGYEELAKELSKIKNLSAVFIPTSSGTTAQGLYEGFKKLKINPQIHIVQTTACHPIVSAIHKLTPTTTKTSLANAIVDNIAHRKEKVIDAVKNSNGAGWIATDNEISKAIKITNKLEKIKLSPNSALSVCGIQSAIKQKIHFDGPVVCLITGK